ncbi:MAG: bifunctional diaminohydroxyphosphoribosylaminopyrimidine deaminase/5-amino-6-(5-phosphoribosylamino)uracil reductase RibD, partial [Burkholderiaceae bacterium]
AEVMALEAAGAAARGSAAYVTLEPHCYQSRTPPCTDALIRAGVSRVLCGALDPNPKVHGEGVRQLRAAGIEVQTGLLESAVRDLNAGFEQRMTSGLPRMIVKVAASLDGRVALANGVSRWITGEAARNDVQHLRAAASAILTGIGTVLADDPQLTVRDPGIETLGRQPLRVVLDTYARTPATARILRSKGATLVFTHAAHGGGADALKRAGAELIGTELDSEGRLDFQSVLRELGERQCNDVLVEAGPTLTGCILQAGLADELIVYLAPVLLGPQARAMAGLPQLDRFEDAPRYTLRHLERIGPDVTLVFRPAARQ